MKLSDLLISVVKFEWDKGNEEKNFLKHKVIIKEIEEIFFDKKLVVFKDHLHSEQEDRYIAMGKTIKKRLLFIVFTLRENKIRVISARDRKKRKEILPYEKTT